MARFTFCFSSAILLAGCGETSAPLIDIYADYEPAGIWQPSTQVMDADVVIPSEVASPEHEITLASTTSELVLLPPLEDAPAEPRLAGLIPICELEPTLADPIRVPVEQEQETPYWSFRTTEEPVEEAEPPLLIRLPLVEKSIVKRFTVGGHFEPEELQFGQLLAPQEVPQESSEAIEPPLELTNPHEGLTEIAVEVIEEVVEAPLPVLDDLTKQERQLAAQLAEASSATTGVLTDGRVNELAKAKIQHAYEMANRSALYVARRELIEVLRMISQAKDAQVGTPERTVALSAGLRALREAEDFAPSGTQLEAELNIEVLCASHRTPIAQQADAMKLLPRLMMDRYLRYAQLQLALSVAGEPAGSMALHALGKISSQLGRAEPDMHRLADRQAIAYQQAALLSHNQNYLAAHELGVLLATSGHFAEAEQLLLQVAAREPNAVVYRNLARVQDKLGQPQQALANRDYAHQLSQQGATGTSNVHWVEPEQFADSVQEIPRYSTAQRPTTGQPPLPGSRAMAPMTTMRR